MNSLLFYPSLEWPQGRPRVPGHNRETAVFKEMTEVHGPTGAGMVYQRPRPVTMGTALDRLFHELEMACAGDVVICADWEITSRDQPRAQQPGYLDPAVATYFDAEGRAISLSCDKWTRHPDNIVAIAKHIEAMRGMARWGCGTMAQMFAGFAALPPPDFQQPKTWRDVLDVGPAATLAEVEHAFRRLAQRAHPDRGGDAARFAELQAARAQARRDLGQAA